MKKFRCAAAENPRVVTVSSSLSEEHAINCKSQYCENMGLILHCHQCPATISLYNAEDAAHLQELAAQRGWIEMNSRWWLCKECGNTNEAAPVRCAQNHGAWIASGTRGAISRRISVNEALVQEHLSNGTCVEKRRLLDEFGKALEELLALHEQQFQAVLQADPECTRFDLLIHMANEKKQVAKYAYLAHVESHGCADVDAITNET